MVDWLETIKSLGLGKSSWIIAAEHIRKEETIILIST